MADTETEVYAVAPATLSDFVFDITAGERYLVVEDGDVLFTIVDDAGDEIDCLWDCCAHLDGGNWTRAEVAA